MASDESIDPRTNTSVSEPDRTSGFRFIVIADSHIRPPDQEVDAYPSNASLVRRSEFVVDLCNRIDAAFVVHLGDIVHPLPVEATHHEAIDLARGVYANLRHPVHFVAGNHDVGDKPNAFVAVPAVAEENYPAFEDAWGPSFRSFDVRGCHFVILDTQLLGSGLDREHRQRMWLVSDLEAATSSGQRIFVFTHYPPFVRDVHESEHYDNLGEPGRSWLLDLFVRHDVEAVFAGHVHHFLYNRHEGTDLYVAPATGFVRPDYSELAAVPPQAENGRDDPPKLGVLIVDVTDEGHDAMPLRSYGSVEPDQSLPVSLASVLDREWESPLGVTMRHAWMAVTDFPTAGLDEFTRKRIRNDAPLLALWEARIRHVRVPLGDLSTPSAAERLINLTRRGMRFSVFSPGVPDQRSIETVRSLASHLHRWELVAPSGQFGDVLASIEDARIDGVTLAISPIVPIGGSDTAVQHFVSAGFSVHDDPELEDWFRLDALRMFSEVVFRVPYTDDVDEGLHRAQGFVAEQGRRAVAIVELPRGTESSVFADDDAVAQRVAATADAAISHRDVATFLDGFVDHDRGYYPRHCLIDRSFNPRQALYRLIEVASADQA
ncbi:MAG: metallophosphoesterase [Acidimicrobiia bacterium]|nr:MAG: metallophosphoesterase [Acidimicrobiia bacterium]